MHFGDFLEGGSGPCCMEVSAARPLGKTNYLHFPRGLQRHKIHGAGPDLAVVACLGRQHHQ